MQIHKCRQFFLQKKTHRTHIAVRPTDRLYRRGDVTFGRKTSPEASLTSPEASFSSIAPRPRGSSAEGCYFLRQEKRKHRLRRVCTKEFFPQERASRAFAADFGELLLNKKQCFEFAEPRALQAPLASPHYHADGGKCSLPSRYGGCLPNLIRETGNGWRLIIRTS